MADKNSSIWNMAVAIAGVYFQQVNVDFPMQNRSGPSKVVQISQAAGATGFGLPLMAAIQVDSYSWEYACIPVLEETLDNTALRAQYRTDAVGLANYLYDMLYARLVELGRVLPT